MDDLERIRRQIDSPQDALLLLADIHEERGENVVAEGYRILHAKGRWPRLLDGLWAWNSGGNGWRLGKPENLPSEAMRLLAGHPGSASASAALEAAVLPVAWHERGWRVSSISSGRHHGPLPCDPPPGDYGERGPACCEHYCGPHLYCRMWFGFGWRAVSQLPDGTLLPEQPPDGRKILALWIAAGGLPKSAPEKKARRKKIAS